MRLYICIKIHIVIDDHETCRIIFFQVSAVVPEKIAKSPQMSWIAPGFCPAGQIKLLKVPCVGQLSTQICLFVPKGVNSGESSIHIDKKQFANAKHDTLKSRCDACGRSPAREFRWPPGWPACWLSVGLCRRLTGWQCINLCIGCSVGGESGSGLNTRRAVLTEQISAQSSGQMLR